MLNLFLLPTISWLSTIPVFLIPAIGTCNSLDEVSSSGHIHFLGRRYSHNKWAALKKRVTCLGRNGYWTKDDIPTKNKLPRNMDVQSPCKTAYNVQNSCINVLNSSCIDYSWEVRASKTGGGCEDTMVPFNRNHMCRMIKHGPHTRNILTLGDSVTGQLTVTLANFFYQQTPGRECKELFTTYLGEDPLPCSDDSNKTDIWMVSRRSDRLTLNTEFIYDMKNNFMDQPFLDTLDKNISLLILNRGAHFQEDDLLMNATNATLHFIRQNYPRISIVWRNTATGYLQTQEAFNDPPLVDEAPPTDIWGWRRFAHQNELMESFLAKHYPEVLYLDVYHMTQLRHDCRANDIHFCIPGPTDTYVTYLYNALRIVTSTGSPVRKRR